jgi:hypothetical protein
MIPHRSEGTEEGSIKRGAGKFTHITLQFVTAASHVMTSAKNNAARRETPRLSLVWHPASWN